MGFFYWLNPLNWFRKSGDNETAAEESEAVTFKATPAAVETESTPCAAVTAEGTNCKRSARDGSDYCGLHKNYGSAKPAAEPSDATPCAAVTAEGTNCKRSARDGSDYCGLHKNYGKAEAKAAPAKKAAAKPASDGTPCAAVTAEGTNCKRSARDGSKYCGLHKNYRASSDAPKAAAPAKKAPAKKAATKKAPAKKAAKADDKKAEPQCGAITAGGAQCSRASRIGSKYCGLHKGYRPPSKSVASKAKDTEPTVKAAKDTKPAARREQVTKYGYGLYQNGNRFFFSKKAQKEVKGKPVYEMPADRKVVRTPNGLPVLKKKD